MRVRTEAKRDSILRCASEVFAEEGYERASMAQIAARVGGSKATLYGYFPSKEALFAAVVKGAAEGHLQSALDDLVGSAGDDLAAEFTRFGEKFVRFLVRPDAIARRRMVIAEAGRSEVGRHYHEAGPAHGIAVVSARLESLMASGRLRAADPEVAAEHLLALLQSEVVPRALLGMVAGLTRPFIRQAVARAVAVFLAGYAPSPVA